MGKNKQSITISGVPLPSSCSDVARQGSVVTVHTQRQKNSEQAADILDEYGAVNIDDRAAQYSTGDDFCLDKSDAAKVSTIRATSAGFSSGNTCAAPSMMVN